MATSTPNYGLHQWEAKEQFRRTDFNEGFKKIDTVLAEMDSNKADAASANSNFISISTRLHLLERRCEVLYGQYTGDGSSRRLISLYTTPKLVLVESVHGMRTSYGYGGMAVEGYPCANGTHTIVEITTNGFYVFESGSYAATNENNAIYRYLVVQSEA